MSGLRGLLLAGLGGFLGSAGRFALTGWTARSPLLANFPVGTLLVNVAGSLAIGLLAGVGESRQIFGSATRAFLFAGLLGGFTTFSSFAHETLELARGGDAARALVNVALQLGLGLGAAALGYAVGRSAGG